MRRALFLFGLLAIGVNLSAADSDPFDGLWTSNNSKSTLPQDYQFKSVTLRFAVVFDAVAVGSKFVTASGQEQTLMKSRPTARL